MDRTGILWLADQLKLKVLTPNSKNIHVSCPLSPYSKFHKSVIDRKPSMGVKVEERGISSVHCFTCNFGGTLSHLLLKLYGLSRDSTYLKLMEEVEKREEEDVEYLASIIGDYEDTEQTDNEVLMDEKIIRPWMRRTHKSLLERGIDTNTLKIWDCGYDRERKALIFPVRNRRWDLVGYVRGSVRRKSNEAKYINEGFQKGKYIYGEHLFEEGSSLVIVEGNVDCLHTWQEIKKANLLRKYSVGALLGAQATKLQARKILDFTDEVIYFQDNDLPGKEGKLETSRKLYDTGIVQKEIIYPITAMGGDPDAILQEGVDLISLIENAQLLL